MRYENWFQCDSCEIFIFETLPKPFGNYSFTDWKWFSISLTRWKWATNQDKQSLRGKIIHFVVIAKPKFIQPKTIWAQHHQQLQPIKSFILYPFNVFLLAHAHDGAILLLTSLTNLFYIESCEHSTLDKIQKTSIQIQNLVSSVAHFTARKCDIRHVSEKNEIYVLLIFLSSWGGSIHAVCKSSTRKYESCDRTQ